MGPSPAADGPDRRLADLGDEALQFRFATPSKTHSPLTEEHGGIVVYVYLPSPLGASHARGTEAGAIIGQPTVRIPRLTVGGTDEEVAGGMGI